MPRRPAFFSPSREYFALVVVLVVSAVLIQTNEVPQMTRVRAQVESTVASLTSPFRVLPHALQLWKENAILRRQVLVFSQENARLKEAVSENIRLRKLLGFKEQEQRSVIAAEVVGRGAPLLPNRLLLNMGEHEGVKERSAVVTADGLVGKIIRVGPNSAVVGILMDRNMGVAAMLQESRVDGIIHWDGGRYLWLDHIPITTTVQPGERVTTSGLGGIYPKGLLIGLVKDIRDAPDGLFKIIRVNPSVDFNRLEEVFVLEPFQREAESLMLSK
jgi:rod shape-determining protein MreC